MTAQGKTHPYKNKEMGKRLPVVETSSEWKQLQRCATINLKANKTLMPGERIYFAITFMKYTGQV
jgi:hypothetical protein